MEWPATAPEPTLRLRPQATITDYPERLVLDTLHTVQLCHPGYPDMPHRLHVMLELPAYDCDDAGAGIHRDTAIDACRIVTGNRPGVLLPTLLSPSQFQQRAKDASLLILTGPRYYFYPIDWSDANLQYPVCPSFSRWEFDHDAFDPASPRAIHHWISSHPQPKRTGDAACRLSGFRDACESAHIIPCEQNDWFVRNGMGLYSQTLQGSATNPTADVRNVVSMRRDLRKSFDDCEFVFLPKGLDFYVHFLSPTLDFGPLFHNRAVSALAEDVAPAFLYARFAWALFGRFWRFVSLPGIRRQTWNVELCRWTTTDEDASDPVDTESYASPELASRNPADISTPPTMAGQQSSGERALVSRVTRWVGGDSASWVPPASGDSVPPVSGGRLGQQASHRTPQAYYHARKRRRRERDQQN